MKLPVQAAVAGLIFVTISTLGFADEGHKKHGNGSTATKDAHHAPDGAHEHSDSAAGRPGDPRKISQTIKVTAMDIKYDSPKFRSSQAKLSNSLSLTQASCDTSS